MLALVVNFFQIEAKQTTITCENPSDEIDEEKIVDRTE